MLGATWPGSVDLSRLPATGKLHNVDYAVVDGETFDCVPTSDHTLREAQEACTHFDPHWGEQQVEQAAQEVIEEVKSEWLKDDVK